MLPGPASIAESPACCSTPDQLQTRCDSPARSRRCRAAAWKCFSSVSTLSRPAACHRQSGRREPPPALRAARPWTPAPAAHPSRRRYALVSVPVPRSAAATAWSGGEDLYTLECRSCASVGKAQVQSVDQLQRRMSSIQLKRLRQRSLMVLIITLKNSFRGYHEPVTI